MGMHEGDVMAVDSATRQERDPGLVRNTLSLRNAVVMSVATMAPAAAIFFNTIPQSGVVGAAIPLTYVVGFVICLLVANQVALMAREMPGSGSFYTFVARGLGARWGFLTGWLSLICYGIVAPFAFLALSSSLQADVQRWTGVNIAWEIWLVIAAVVVFGIVYLGIQQSLRIDMTFIAFEVGVCIALGLTVLVVLGGRGQLTSTPFTLQLVPKGANFFLGVVLAILSFVGFEAASTLGAETRNPRRNIPRAVFGSALAIGVFYIFMSYVAVSGYGISKMTSFSTNAAPFDTIARHFWNGTGASFVDIAGIVSFYALAVAITNGSSRIIYTMGREGLFPRWVGTTKTSRHIPRNAIVALAVVAIVLGLGLGYWQTPIVAYGFLGTLDTLAILVVYGLVNVACFWYFYRKSEGRFKVVRHAVVPALATAAVAAVFIGNVYPVPAAPYNTPPWITLVWIVIGLGVFAVLAKRQPAVVSRAGHLFESGDGTEPAEGVGNVAPETA
jgi:amino acid transporter